MTATGRLKYVAHHLNVTFIPWQVLASKRMPQFMLSFTNDPDSKDLLNINVKNAFHLFNGNAFAERSEATLVRDL